MDESIEDLELTLYYTYEAERSGDSKNVSDEMKSDLELLNSLPGPDDGRTADRPRSERLEVRLHGLERDGIISDYNSLRTQKRIPVNARNGRRNLRQAFVEKFDEYRGWARRNDLTLTPHFRINDKPRTDLAVVPPIYLVARRGLKVRGVFPCTDGTDKYQIEDYLDALEAGEDWRQGESQNSLTTPDYGIHGSIKSHIENQVADTIGPDWELYSDEETYIAGRGISDVNRIDLIFQHQDERRYCLVEIKPDQDGVDKAFGQILRYKWAFLDSQAIDLDPDHVRLVVAAPRFRKTHCRAADEIGIELIKVPVEP